MADVATLRGRSGAMAAEGGAGAEGGPAKRNRSECNIISYYTIVLQYSIV